MSRDQNDRPDATPTEKFKPRFKGHGAYSDGGPGRSCSGQLLAPVTRARHAATHSTPSNGSPLPWAKMYWPVYAEADRLGCSLAVHGGCTTALAWITHEHVRARARRAHPWGLTINWRGYRLQRHLRHRFRETKSCSSKAGLPGDCCCSNGCMRPTRLTSQSIFLPPTPACARARTWSRYIIKRSKTACFFLGVHTEGYVPCLSPSRVWAYDLSFIPRSFPT